MAQSRQRRYWGSSVLAEYLAAHFSRDSPYSATGGAIHGTLINPQPPVILSPCRTKTIICYLATRRCRIAGVDVAKRLSYSSSAVSQSAKRGRQIFEDDETLRGLLD